MLKKLTDALVKLNVDRVGELVRQALDGGNDPIAVLEAIQKGMEDVGQLFENGEYFLSELIMAGECSKEAIRILQPHLASVKAGYDGKVVLGTIIGDLHDIGKNIVNSLLVSAGLDVYDLGIDVPPEKFAEKAEEENADVIGVSALLTTSLPACEEVVKTLKNKGLRPHVKIILGGAAVRPWTIERYRVDAAVNNAVEGVNIIKSWVKRNEVEGKDSQGNRA